MLLAIMVTWKVLSCCLLYCSGISIEWKTGVSELIHGALHQKSLVGMVTADSAVRRLYWQLWGRRIVNHNVRDKKPVSWNQVTFNNHVIKRPLPPYCRIKNHRWKVWQILYQVINHNTIQCCPFTTNNRYPQANSSETNQFWYYNNISNDHCQLDFLCYMIKSLDWVENESDTWYYNLPFLL